VIIINSKNSEKCMGVTCLKASSRHGGS